MALPLPGSPSFSWARLQAKFDGVSARVCIAFWLFGLVNNCFYVILLTAALDLVGASGIPKATVLLASIIPGLSTKVVTPYVISSIPYALRVPLLSALSAGGMLAVALSPDNTDAKSLAGKVAGIVLANVSSGAGEVNFLSLTHYYGHWSLAGWSSGTGGAGLIGAGLYTLATTTFGFSVRATLLASISLTVVMMLSYFALLPLDPLNTSRRAKSGYKQVETDDHIVTEPHHEPAGLFDPPSGRPASPAYQDREENVVDSALLGIKMKLLRARTLLVPYMVPLFLVYLAEYTINQGVSPTLLFPLDQSPFKHFRAFYPTYGTIYQAGVFISRSSLAFIRIRSLYVPSFLQLINLFALTAHALWPFIPTVWFVFAIIFWEGLLGGLVYVSTFAAVREEVPQEEREFSLGAVTVSDSAGIFFAGILGAGMETALCSWQVNHGRDWCRRL